MSKLKQKLNSSLGAGYPAILSRKRGLLKSGEDILFCKIDGCNRKHYAKCLCHKHYNQICLYEYREKYQKKWRSDNKSRISKYRKQYNFNHKEQIAEYQKQYQQDNKERKAKYSRQYNQTPAGKASMKAKAQNRRLALSDLTKVIIQRVYEANIAKYGRLTCCLCFKPIEFGDDSLEHLTPLSRGGSNDFGNLGIAHFSCNIKKGTMTLEEWFEKFIERIKL